MMMAFTTVLFTLVGFNVQGMGPDHTRDALLTEKDAVFLLEPEVVAASGANRLRWSPDGTFLLVQRTQLTGPHPFTLLAQGKPFDRQIAGEHQFLIYSAPSRKTVTSLRLPMSSTIREIAWLPGSSKALVLADEVIQRDPAGPADVEQNLYWVTASGESRRLARSADNEMLQLFVSPVRPMAALARTKLIRRKGAPEEETQTLQFFDGEGRALGNVGFTDPTDELVWGGDGSVYATVRRVENRKLVTDWFALSPTRGTRQKLDRWSPPAPKKAPDTEFVVESVKVPSAAKEMPPVEAVVMAQRAKPQTFVFVSTDAGLGALSPNETSVAYVHRGVAMVRQVTRLPKQLYIEMKSAADRAVAMSNSKQAALALIMNAADHDDTLVASNGDWRSAIGPYLKNDQILNGFVYTYGGGPMSAIENPAETVVGYTPGPGGRAVAYADGHVKWIPDKA